MRFFPKEIECDLLFKGVDINDWHQGRMSSRRLLNLIEMLDNDPDSCLARERRDGDWSEKEYILAAMVNEQRLARADQAAMHNDFRMDVNMVESPAQRQADEDLSARSTEVRKHIMSQLRGNTTE